MVETDLFVVLFATMYIFQSMSTGQASTGIYFLGLLLDCLEAIKIDHFDSQLLPVLKVQRCC